MSGLSPLLSHVFSLMEWIGVERAGARRTAITRPLVGGPPNSCRCMKTLERPPHRLCCERADDQSRPTPHLSPKQW